MLSVVRLLSFMVFAVSLFIQSNSNAATQVVFGPKSYSPGLLKPIDVTEQFASSVLTGTIKVVNGDGKDIVIPVCSGNVLKKILCEASNLITKAELALTRATSFSVELNSGIVVSQSNLPTTKGSIEIPITLKASNTIRVRVAGSFLSKIKIEVSTPTGTINQLPIASMQLSHVQGFAPLTITANGLASVDPDGSIVDFVWDFGDGGISSGAVASHIYTTPGSYQVRLTVKDNNGATNAQTKQVLVLQNQIPTADLRLVSSGVGLAPLMVIFDGSHSRDPENGTLRYFWNFGDGSAQFEGRPNETHEFANAGLYSVVLIVRDENGGQAQSSVSVEVKLPVLPPAPETVAPSLAEISYPTFEDKVSFLYTGANPIQTGVNLEAIDSKRLSVIHGSVFDGEGAPLSGVTVKILNEGDFGQTLSRADGQFDLAFNSGDFVNVEYSKNGYTLAQRKISVKNQDYYSAEDVRLVKLDTSVTPITVGANVSQVAQGSKQTDSFGERTGTVIFPPQTQASIVMSDGSTRTVSNLNIRVTEYTVGEDGPKKMPATLPAQSAYTYAMSINADEALALGSRSIKFSKPVSYYVDNFLNFPVGVAVPVGSYDTTIAAWRPEADGIVIKIIGRTAQGIAQVDLGAGRAANSSELAALGFDTSELASLATKYSDGVSLWRMQTTHFSDFDMNPPRRIIDIDNGSDAEGEDTDIGIEEGKCPGCEILVESKVMKETLSLPGLPFNLSYSTDRVPGRKSASVITALITPDVLPNNLKRIDVFVDVAGRRSQKSFQPEPNLQYRYQWDGLDAYGRLVTDYTLAKVLIKYVYQETYALAPYSNGVSGFGGFAPANATSFVPGKSESSIDSKFEIALKASQKIQSPSAKNVANGWYISNHHIYDVNQNKIFYGDGSELSLKKAPFVYSTLAGGGSAGFSGDGGLARFAKLNGPTSATKAADGSIFIADKGNNRIRKISPDGVIDTVAGNGMSGYAGDNGPASDAVLNHPHSVTVNRDGSYFIIDTGNNCIRQVDVQGTISTFAGVCGQSGFTVGDKRTSLLNKPLDIVTNGDGAYYVSDTGNHAIRRISPAGQLSTIAGNGSPGFSGDGGDLSLAQFSSPRVTHIDISGNLYIADTGNNRVRKILNSGLIKTMIGTGEADYNGFFLAPFLYNVGSPKFVAAAPGGETYFTNPGNSTISFLDRNGTVNPLIGYRDDLDPVDLTYATGTTAKIVDVQSIELFSDGTKLFADAGTNSITTFGEVRPNREAQTLTLVSEDGSEVFVFDLKGTHLQTLYGKTGAIKYSFEYNNENLLVGITDSFANRTVLSRSGAILNQIMGPYGHVSTLGIDGNGNLNQITNPGGNSISIVNTAEGLITSIKLPKGNTSNYSYNEIGELERETNPQGGTQSLIKIDALVTKYITGLGKTLSVYQQTDEDGYEKTTTDGAGRQRYETVYSGSHSNQEWDQSILDITKQYDSRSRGITKFSGNITQWSESFLSERQTTSRRYEFPTGNYFEFNLKETVTRDFDKVSQKNYDYLTRTETNISPVGRTFKRTIDLKERPILQQTGTLEAIISEYDSHGRLALIKHGDRLKRFVYDNKGQLSKTIDPLGQEQSFTYDLNNRMVQKIRPDGEATNYSYDINSNLSAVKPPMRDWHLFEFNAFDYIGNYSPSAGSRSSIVYTYSDDRELLSKLLPDGQKVQYNFEPGTRRPIGASNNDGTQAYTLEYKASNGKIAKAISSDGITVNYDHDAFLPIQMVYSGAVIASVSNTYGGITGGAFQISSQSVEGSEMKRVYDADRNLIANGPATLQIDSNGLLSNVRLGAVQQTDNHNQYGEVIRRIFTVNGVEFYSENYSRDLLARVETKVISRQGLLVSTNYVYDSLGRLIKAIDGSGVVRSYSYDPQGNRITANSLYDVEDRLLRIDDLQFTYTPNGEVKTKTNTSNGESAEFAYDVFGSLKRVVNSEGKNVEYLTDAGGRRTVKSVNGVVVSKFVRNTEGKLIAELDSANQLKSHFIYLSQAHSPDGMRRNGALYFFVKDQLGSIRFVINSQTGVIAQELAYDDFGKVTMDTNPGFQPFGFAGGHFDPDTQLLRFGARDYDASVGRWMSKDPIRFAGGGTNLYSYSSNDPINLIDPSGLEFVFADRESEIVFNNLRNNPALSREDKQRLDALQLSKEIITISQGDPAKRPDAGVWGSTTGHKNDNGSDIEIWTGGTGNLDQSVLLHEIQHSEQLIDGKDPKIPGNEEEARRTGDDFYWRCP